MTQVGCSRSQHWDRACIDWVKIQVAEWREVSRVSTHRREGDNVGWTQGEEDPWCQSHRASASPLHSGQMHMAHGVTWIYSRSLAFIFLHGSATGCGPLWEGWALGRDKSWRRRQLDGLCCLRRGVGSTGQRPPQVEFQSERWGLPRRTHHSVFV